MVQELEVAAGDGSETTFNETNNGIAQRRGLPRFGSDACVTEDGVADLAIAGPVHPAIGSLDHQSQASALLIGDACVGRDFAAVEAAPEPGEGFDPAERFRVDRDDRCKWRSRIAPGKDQDFGGEIAGQESVCPFGAIAPGAESGEGRIRS